MKITDARWEERNLGVTCYELHVEMKDDFEKAKEMYFNLPKKEYMVARVPTMRSDFLEFFQEEGYTFIEAAVRLEHNMKEIPVPERILRVCNKCTWEKMGRDDLVELRNEIYKNIFKTDRVYLDPAFSKQQAARRYDFWIQDLINAGNVPYKVMYNGETVGFYLYKEVEPNVFDGLLAGTYHAYEGAGMGYCVQYAGIKSALDKGARKYIGNVSASNLTVLKILLSIGFHIKTVEYVFIKHNKGDE